MTEKQFDSDRGSAAASIGSPQQHDLSGVVSIAASNPDPKEGAAMFAALVKHLYADRKDVPAMIAAGEAGVKFCLEAADAAGGVLARDLKTTAKAVAYNTAANCWPGWGDDGIVIGANDLKSGLALAGLSRNLVHDLALGHKETGTAHWLIGALMLAAGRPVEARAEFQRATDAFQAAGERSLVLMARGYSAMAKKADPAIERAAERELLEAVHALRNEGSKQASFFADQIVTAERLLLG